METPNVDSLECIAGDFPAMTPMFDSVWRTVAPAVISEGAHRGKINIVTTRVGLLTEREWWVHQCQPRAIYNRLRAHAIASAECYPRARFSLKVMDETFHVPRGAQLLIDGKLVVSPAADQRPEFTWHWLRTLASFYTATNGWDRDHVQCNKCHKWLSPREKTLLNLAILGRRINGSQVA